MAVKQSSIIQPIPQVGCPPELKLEIMIQDPKYENSLFIFPDSLEIDMKFDSRFLKEMRSYNCHGQFKSRPRSAGIPIGTNSLKPFIKLSDSGAAESINLALDEIRTLIKNHNYTNVFFPAVYVDFTGTVRFGLNITATPGERGLGQPYRAGVEVENYITAALLAMEI